MWALERVNDVELILFSPDIYGSASGKFMGEGFQFIDIVLFAMIAAFLILRLRNVLGRHRDHGRPEDGFGVNRLPPKKDDNSVLLPDQMDPTEKAIGDDVQPVVQDKEESSLDLGFTEIKQASPEFDRKEFLVGVHAAFEIIIKAFSEGDREQLETLLSAEVFSNFSASIAAREEAKERVENVLIRIVSADPLDAFVENQRTCVTVKIISEQINVTHNQEGEVVAGEPDHVSEITDIWTFARDTKSEHPNWTLVATRSLE